MALLGKKSVKHDKKATQGSQPHSQRLSHYWLLAGVLLSLATLAAFVVAAWLGTGTERKMQEQHLSELVNNLAGALDDHKERLYEQLRELSKDQHLRTSFEYADQADFVATAQHLQQRIPLALQLLLVRLEPGSSDVQILNQATTPLSYAGLVMVREVATSGKLSQLEAHQVGTPEAHLALAGPVLASDGQTTLGVIYVALPLSLLPKPDAATARNHHFLFQQGRGQDQAIIAPAAASLPPADALVASTKIPRTDMELIAWQPPPQPLDSQLLWSNLIGAGALLAMTLLILAAAGSAQSRRLHREIDQLNRGLAEVDLGQVPSKRTVQLQELAVLDEGLRQMSRKRAHVAKAPAAETPDMALDLGSKMLDGDPAEAAMEMDLANPPSQLAGTSEMPTNARSSNPLPRVDVSALGTIPARVFRPYDIRGLIATELTEDFMRFLGYAIGTESQDGGSRAVLVGRDHRASGASLCGFLTEGLRASGCDVIDLGIVPTPVLYFATHLAGDISGAMITASHNPHEYNGVKLVLSGKSATALNVAKLKQRLQRGEFRAGEGSYREQSVLADYFDEVEQNITFARPLKLAIDCGFATPALVAPQLFRDLGCEVIEVRCDLEDPRAGTELPNPSAPEHLRDLIDAVTEHQADLGIGFDGDGDRLGVVDSAGQLIQTERVLMLLAADLLSRAPSSDIVFDVKCSGLLTKYISSLGGKPVMWKSGHAFIKEKREELKAPLAGEFSGHIVFGDRWNGFDDAFYAAARLIEVLAIDSRSTQEIFAELPTAISTPELLAPVAPGQELEIMSQVMEVKGRLSGVTAITIDGLRVESDRGWALVRASNSEAALAFRFEAVNESTLEKLKDLVRRIMKSAAPGLELPF
ncbi:phosphomannomutase/phosphoglucomutase [Rhabdochromatium marinum]|uniref:phosphomannomutase/phosphoglucomutase n=1 Tax=Rhabdochromatium marinum TaxID=48729 RepID=UPI001904B7DC|nr:phosphomannomutase/phosphoglucomutase [Rhabdochromatium marinum]MBK1648694.1 hypothetical protein [Rhabdochromatium marinum]